MEAKYEVLEPKLEHEHELESQTPPQKRCKWKRGIFGLATLTLLMLSICPTSRVLRNDVTEYIKSLEDAFESGWSLGTALGEAARKSSKACDELSRENRTSPGFGFDFASSYATAAVNHPNGTTVDIGRIEGSEQYLEIMARLIHNESKDTDVEVMTTMLGQLIYLAQETLEDKTPSVHNFAVSMPSRKSYFFSTAEVEKACRIAGTNSTEARLEGGSVWNVDAARVGMGVASGDVEEHQALVISYTYDQIIVRTVTVHEDQHSTPTVQMQSTDFAYGAWDVDRSNTAYWDSVSGMISSIVKDSKIEELVLMGEYAEDKDFLDVVWRTLAESKQDVQELWKLMQRSGFSAKWAAARGAAELAGRKRGCGC